MTTELQQKWDAPPRKVGRPKGRKSAGIGEDIKALAKQLAPEALETLAVIMRDKTVPAAARVSAANSIIERGYGKAVQPSELSGPGGAPVQLQFIVRRAGEDIVPVRSPVEALPQTEHGDLLDLKPMAVLPADGPEPVVVNSESPRPALSVVGKD
jgi:hypothetical protein